MNSTVYTRFSIVDYSIPQEHRERFSSGSALADSRARVAMASDEAEETRTVISSEDDGVLDTVASIHSKLTGENGDDEAVLESLRQLQALPMTFRVLEATRIGRAVNALRKSASSELARKLASALYRSWKDLAEEPAAAPSDISEQKLEAAASPETRPKAATKSVRRSLPTKATPPSGPSPSACKRKEGSPTSSRDMETVKKQRSTQPSDGTRKAEQPDATIRQRAAAVPKPAPASSKPSGSDKEASLPAPKTMKIVIKRVARAQGEATPGG
jgi:hypothetical protein